MKLRRDLYYILTYEDQDSYILDFARYDSHEERFVLPSGRWLKTDKVAEIKGFTLGQMIKLLRK